MGSFQPFSRKTSVSRVFDQSALLVLSRAPFLTASFSTVRTWTASTLSSFCHHCGTQLDTDPVPTIPHRSHEWCPERTRLVCPASVVDAVRPLRRSRQPCRSGQRVEGHRGAPRMAYSTLGFLLVWGSSRLSGQNVEARFSDPRTRAKIAASAEAAAVYGASLLYSSQLILFLPVGPGVTRLMATTHPAPIFLLLEQNFVAVPSNRRASSSFVGFEKGVAKLPNYRNVLQVLRHVTRSTTVSMLFCCPSIPSAPPFCSYLLADTPD